MRRRLVKDVIKGQTVLTLPPEATVGEAARRMKAGNVGSVIVVAGGGVTGIFTERDALFRVLAAGLAPEATPLAKVMTGSVTTVAADSTLLDALHLMHEGGFRHVPVLQGGVPIGIVSIRDALGNELEDFRQELQRKEELAEIVG